MSTRMRIPKDDSIETFVPVKTLEDEEYIKKPDIIMATKEGQIKKTSLEAYSRPRKNGIKAINIREGDSLLEASLTDGDSTVLLANRSGRAIRFHENDVREMGRNTSGVRGMTIEKGDEMVEMVVMKN